MALMQIRDAEGHKVLLLEIAEGKPGPELPYGFTLEGADDTPLWQALPEMISDRQFAQALALDGTITEAEALAWAARGELPEAMEAALVLVPEKGGQQFGARMMLAAATTYERHHPLTAQLGALLVNTATGKTYDATALDALWTRAAAL